MLRALQGARPGEPGPERVLPAEAGIIRGRADAEVVPAGIIDGHPSTHGVLRLVLKLEGETVVDCTPVIGYLHRGIEKILENRPVMGGIRYMDNADYLSPMLNEIAYAGAVEQPERSWLSVLWMSLQSRNALSGLRSGT